MQDGDKLYRLTPQEKVNVNEAYVKEYVKELKKEWPAFAKTYANTPWAVVAACAPARKKGLCRGLAQNRTRRERRALCASKTAALVQLSRCGAARASGACTPPR